MNLKEEIAELYLMEAEVAKLPIMMEEGATLQIMKVEAVTLAVYPNSAEEEAAANSVTLNLAAAVAMFPIPLHQMILFPTVASQPKTRPYSP